MLEMKEEVELKLQEFAKHACEEDTNVDTSMVESQSNASRSRMQMNSSSI